MRKSEVLAITWSDVVSLQDGRKLVAVRQSKTDQPRLVYCTRTMVEVLQRQETGRVQGDDRIFALTRMTLRRKWDKLRKAIGLADVTIHDLRRTHGTHAAASGVDLRTLADRIGHADLTMLQRHYAAVVGSAAAEAAETFQNAFDQMISGANRGR
jgi:integrase